MNKFDPDHALAIILQAKFNEETKKKTAKKENLPTSEGLTEHRSSLVDPDWEVTDPCPDIHGLFLAFNDRFFWGRLLGVEVKWSPQMTSCAGICVYEGRNGLCSVRLSAPLLKLRPRSDLVETLLHEMIHAYLFVTHNNRDRDGHGPEFHKHMNRINKEAGTNISVYHSFHAEVKLYQQHWWRCNGSCQKRAPFFGMVKRAKNRAPGPNDFWWGDHQAMCGGSFVKIREPQGYGAKTKSKQGKTTKPKEGSDIRDFFKKSVGSTSTLSQPLRSEKDGNNIFSLKNFDSNHSSNFLGVKSSNNVVNRVVGFDDISTGKVSQDLKKNSLKTVGSGNKLGMGNQTNHNGKDKSSNKSPKGGIVANKGGGTIILSGKYKTDENLLSPNTKLRINTFTTFAGAGFTLGGSTNNNDRSKSRLLRLDSQPEKKKFKSDVETPIKPIQKLTPSNSPQDIDKKEDICKCSVCNEIMPREQMEIHMEGCEGLKNVFNNSNVTEDVDIDEIDEINRKSKITCCPVCALSVDSDINIHLDSCLVEFGLLNAFDEGSNDVYNKPSASEALLGQTAIALDSPILIHNISTPIDSPIVISDTESPTVFQNRNVPKPKFDSDSDIEIIESERRVACMVCGLRFGESRINSHVNECLDSQED